MEIRTALPSDLPEMLEIYNYEVKNGTATFDLTEKTLEERKIWFDAHNRENHPLLVACEGVRVLGYASLSPYREKQAYAGTVELSVYVAPACRGRGVGTALMQAILALAKEDRRTHTVISVITQGNAQSVRLHERFGFSYSGTLHEVGYKFGKYLDVENYELKV